MNVIDYEKIQEIMSEAGIDVKEYNNYIIQQTISNISAKMMSRAADVISLVSASLDLKHDVYIKLSEMKCNAKEFDTLDNNAIGLLFYALGFSLEEMCEVFHASPIVVSSRVSRYGACANGCVDVSDSAFDNLYRQILATRGENSDQ